jgi:hypothetical protein
MNRQRGLYSTRELNVDSLNVKNGWPRLVSESMFKEDGFVAIQLCRGGIIARHSKEQAFSRGCINVKVWNETRNVNLALVLLLFS